MLITRVAFEQFKRVQQTTNTEYAFYEFFVYYSER